MSGGVWSTSSDLLNSQSIVNTHQRGINMVTAIAIVYWITAVSVVSAFSFVGVK